MSFVCSLLLSNTAIPKHKIHIPEHKTYISYHNNAYIPERNKAVYLVSELFGPDILDIITNISPVYSFMCIFKSTRKGLA